MMRKRREARVLRTLAVLERLSAPQREAVQASLEILVNACSAVQPGSGAVSTAARAKRPMATQTTIIPEPQPAKALNQE